MEVKLPRIPEPKDLKEQWKRELRNNNKLAIASIKQGTWFTKPYWDQFKDILKAQGVTWQNLMEAYGLSQYKFIEWIKDEEVWDNVLSFLEEQLNSIIKLKGR